MSPKDLTNCTHFRTTMYVYARSSDVHIYITSVAHNAQVQRGIFSFSLVLWSLSLLAQSHKIREPVKGDRRQRTKKNSSLLELEFNPLRGTSNLPTFDNPSTSSGYRL